MTELLTTLAFIFIAAAALLLVANRFGLSTVPVLILAGLVAGQVVDEQLTLEIARYGIALLVFAFGARIRFESIRTVLGDSEIVAIQQVLLVGSLGFGMGLFFGLPAEQALYLGIAAALSSTIVGTGILEPDIRKNLVHGRLAESTHFVQDLLAIVIVLVLGAETFAADPIATQLGYGVALLVAGIAVNRFLFEFLAGLTDGSDELLIVAVIALLIAFLGAAEFVEVSIVVGAFAAGLAIRRDPAEHIGMVNGLTSFRDFFVTVFFVTLGALVSFPSVEVLTMAAALAALTAIVKPAVTIALFIYRGYEARSATLTSLSLDQVSEFALIIAIEALVLGVVFPSVFEAIILAAAATMITSSLSHRYDERIYRTLADHGLLWGQHAKVDQRSSIPEEISDHVVIVGYGRQGQRLVETCQEIGQRYVVVENDPALLGAMDARCECFVFGDAMEPYTWEKAGVEDARLVVSTVDSEPVSERLLSAAGETDVILRCETVPTALDLLERGALYVSISDVLAGERLAEHIEELIEGDLARERLREQHLDELVERPTRGYHTTADELRAMR